MGGVQKDGEEPQDKTFSADAQLTSDAEEVLFYAAPREKNKARCYTIFGFVLGTPLGL